MNISNKGSNGLKPVVVYLKNYGTKSTDKKLCLACDYSFSPLNVDDCYCDTCRAGLRLHAKLKATQAMLAKGGDYGCH